MDGAVWPVIKSIIDVFPWPAIDRSRIDWLRMSRAPPAPAPKRAPPKPCDTKLLLDMLIFSARSAFSLRSSS